MSFKICNVPKIFSKINKKSRENTKKSLPILINFFLTNSNQPIGFHFRFMRKGQVGSFKDELTTDQINRLVEWITKHITDDDLLKYLYNFR